MKKILIKFSGVFFVVIITVILFLIYYLWGPSLGWMEPAEKFRVLCTIFAVPVFLSLLLVSRYSLVAFASRLRFFCKLNDKQNTRSNNSAHLKQVDISKKIINEVQQVLRHTYGHFWHSKVRILLMTGSVSDVEQLAPKLGNSGGKTGGLCCCGVAILRLRPMQTGWLRCVNCAAVRWTEWSG